MKILVLGSSGQLGKCLKDQLLPSKYDILFASRSEIDVTDYQSLRSRLTKIQPEVIINAAAFTAVDKAEVDFEIAEKVNHHAAAQLATLSRELGCWLIHFSTDYVFDGESADGYREFDFTNPKGVYGLTKLRGEDAIRASGCRHLIIRTSWVFSEHGSNFLKTILRLGNNSDELKIVCDQIGCPTYAQDLAKAVRKILTGLTENTLSGVYHFSGDTECSWFDFGVEIFRRAEELGVPNLVSVKPILSSDYPSASERPKYSALNNDKIFETFGVSPSDWRAGITATLKVLLPQWR